MDWELVEYEHPVDGPVPLPWPVYRPPRSLRAQAQRCGLCGWFRDRRGRCPAEIYVHSYGVWEHR